MTRPVRAAAISTPEEQRKKRRASQPAIDAPHRLSPFLWLLGMARPVPSRSGPSPSGIPADTINSLRERRKTHEAAPVYAARHAPMGETARSDQRLVDRRSLTRDRPARRLSRGVAGRSGSRALEARLR